MRNFARQCTLCGRVVLADGYEAGKTHKPLQRTWGCDNSITLIKLSAAKSKNKGFCVCELFIFLDLFWWKFYPSSRPVTWKGAVQNSGFGGSPLKPGRPESTKSCCLYKLHRTAHPHGRGRVSAHRKFP